MTKKDYTKYLNELEVSMDDRKSNGGRIPDHCKYGDWLRKNDPISFEVGYNELKLNNTKTEKTNA